ncbi:hypothetical protein PIB30_103310 [Stylosanthes scabra]|uniref:Ubiquitin-like protease family profile domain-containing protein n=1 Tax=Stylosanthes scabra TaxID=79078 RepID=A0ABU6RYG6_9FABA|nr:hypothetical protein [Stylosanthes scabra]
MDYIKDRYMGIADDLMMIYIPMHTKNHWYLMIVDIWDKKLVYLNSFHSLDCAETEFQGFTNQRCGKHESKDAVPPLVSMFEPDIPPTGQQEYGSMDCGVWDVNERSRMSIAVQLVTSQHNPLCEVISDRAVNYWDAEMLRNHQAEPNSTA